MSNLERFERVAVCYDFFDLPFEYGYIEKSDR